MEQEAYFEILRHSNLNFLWQRSILQSSTRVFRIDGFVKINKVNLSFIEAGFGRTDTICQKKVACHFCLF